VSTWLKDNSLQLNPTKIEFLLFRGRHSGTKFGPLVADIAVRDACHGIYTIHHQPVVCYLGMFLMPSLK
jgi:hypothetical protein